MHHDILLNAETDKQVLQHVADLLLDKAGYNMTERHYNANLNTWLKRKEFWQPDVLAKMPTTFDECLRFLEAAGDGVDLLEYHMCSSDSCGLVYRGAYKNAVHCLRPGCGAERYDAKGNPLRRLYYSRITPWIQRLYADAELAKFMQWHTDRPQAGQSNGDNNDSDILSDVYDGLLWKKVFVEDPVIQENVRLDPVARPGSSGRNVALALCSDGVKPTKRGDESWWPIVLQCLNLPPWMRNRLPAFHVCCVASGGPMHTDAQPVLELIVDELVYLYHFGATITDASVQGVSGKEQNVRAMLLDTRFDLPALALCMRWASGGMNGACCTCKQQGMTCAGLKPVYPGFARFIPVGVHDRLRKECCVLNNPVDPDAVTNPSIRKSLLDHGWEHWNWDAPAPGDKTDDELRQAAVLADCDKLNIDSPYATDIEVTLRRLGVHASVCFYKLRYFRPSVQTGVDSMHALGNAAKAIASVVKGGDYSSGQRLLALAKHEYFVQGPDHMRWHSVLDSLYDQLRLEEAVARDGAGAGPSSQAQREAVDGQPSRGRGRQRGRGSRRATSVESSVSTGTGRSSRSRNRSSSQPRQDDSARQDMSDCDSDWSVGDAHARQGRAHNSSRSRSVSATPGRRRGGNGQSGHATRAADESRILPWQVKSNSVRTAAMDKLKRLCTEGYAPAGVAYSPLHECLNNQGWMKTHDWFNTLGQLGMYAYANCIPDEAIYKVVCDLLNVLGRLWCTSIRVGDIPKLQEDVAIALSAFEKTMPAWELDRTMHVILHYPRRMLWSGGSWVWSLFPFERLWNRLLKWRKSNKYPESSLMLAYSRFVMAMTASNRLKASSIADEPDGDESNIIDVGAGDNGGDNSLAIKQRAADASLFPAYIRKPGVIHIEPPKLAHCHMLSLAHVKRQSPAMADKMLFMLHMFYLRGEFGAPRRGVEQVNTHIRDQTPYQLAWLNYVSKVRPNTFQSGFSMSDMLQLLRNWPEWLQQQPDRRVLDDDGSVLVPEAMHLLLAQGPKQLLYEVRRLVVNGVPLIRHQTVQNRKSRGECLVVARSGDDSGLVCWAGVIENIYMHPRIGLPQNAGFSHDNCEYILDCKWFTPDSDQGVGGAKVFKRTFISPNTPQGDEWWPAGAVLPGSQFVLAPWKSGKYILLHRYSDYVTRDLDLF